MEGFNGLITAYLLPDFYEKIKKYGNFARADNISYYTQLKRLDMVIVTSKDVLTEEMIDEMKKLGLKYVITATNGYWHIKRKYLEKIGIKWFYTPVQTDSVASGTVGIILSLCYKMYEINAASKSGIKTKGIIRGDEPEVKTLGIIGCGKIGQRVAELVEPYKMKVIGYDPYKTSAEKIELCDFDTVLKESDIISLHCDLTDETKNLLDKKEFDKMKSGVYIINTARGEIIDGEALFEALNSGKVSWAVLDVLPKDRKEEFKKNSRTTVGDHNFFDTDQIRKKKGNAVLEIVDKLYEVEFGIIK